ncbi:MAG: helix-turn-helix transcriptional regulator [Bacillota bacterium]
MDLSNILINIRARKGFTQTELAEELGVSIVTINRWENSVSKPSKVARAKIIQYCNENSICVEVNND